MMRSAGENNVVVVDVRPPEAYNGWKMYGEARGGHIPGAKSLPVKWADYIDWIEIVRAKGIDSEKRTLIYGHNEHSVNKVARRFTVAGYPRVSVYNDFVREWSPGDLPMEKMPKYSSLVPPVWLKRLIDKGTAPEYGGRNYVILHAHYMNRGAYEEGHIPGAFELDTNCLESPDTWNRRTPEEINGVLRKMGITKETTVVLYGRFSSPDNTDPFPGSSAGHLGAIRCAFILMYAGVTDVRVLNGGLRAWTDEGYTLSTEDSYPEGVKDTGIKVPERPELAVDTPEAREILSSREKNLVSVRSWKEFTGELSGYNYIEKKGRIPGAVFGNCGSDAYHMENYRNLDHTTREYPEIGKMWAEAGITPDKFNAFYCGTGWRASEAFFNAWLMGWDKIAVYDGGWFEWSNDERNPYLTGVPENLPQKPVSTYI
jgi:thiosulfate/3-mercaptopyruvate sulfurtransferase